MKSQVPAESTRANLIKNNQHPDGPRITGYTIHPTKK